MQASDVDVQTFYTWIPLQNKRIVARDDMIGTVCVLLAEKMSFQHGRHVINGRKGISLLHVCVVMTGVGCKDDPPSYRIDPYGLKSFCMPTYEYQLHTGGHNIVATMKPHAIRIDMPDYLLNIIGPEWMAQRTVAHATAGGIFHLIILNVKHRIGYLAQITRVVVMEMRQYDITDVCGINAQQTQ